MNPPRTPEKIYRIIFPNGDDKHLTTSEILTLPICKVNTGSKLYNRFANSRHHTESEEERAKLRYYSIINPHNERLKAKKIIAMIRGVKPPNKSRSRMKTRYEDYKEIEGVLINTLIFNYPVGAF